MSKVMQEKDHVIDYITLWYISTWLSLFYRQVDRGVPTSACNMEKHVLRVLVCYSIFTSYRIRNPTVTLPFIIIATNTALILTLNNTPSCKISTDYMPGFRRASRDLATVRVCSTNRRSNSDSI